MSETPKQTIHNTEQIKYEEFISNLPLQNSESESESSEIDIDQTCPDRVLCDTILATILPSNKQFRDIMDNLTLQVVEAKKSEAEYDKMKAERDEMEAARDMWKKKYLDHIDRPGHIRSDKYKLWRSQSIEITCRHCGNIGYKHDWNDDDDDMEYGNCGDCGDEINK
tara:strand:+ start:29 stop:529 length:501 start_codon:yes stop_codon:yes gene_type:complete